MSDKKTFSFKCHKINGGTGEGKAVVSSDAINFYNADSETGIIIEKNHALKGKSIACKVVIFPNGKGSSIVQGDGIYNLTQKGTAPVAMIIKEPDTILVAGAVIWRIPLVDKVPDEFYEQVEYDDYIKVEADEGLITLIKAS